MNDKDKLVKILTELGLDPLVNGASGSDGDSWTVGIDNHRQIGRDGVLDMAFFNFTDDGKFVDVEFGSM